MEATKYNARKAILAALLEGRHLSQMDCAEFMVEDMRTPVRNSRIKEYWLERRL